MAIGTAATARTQHRFDLPTVRRVTGCPEAVDAIAGAALPEHSFLRSAWFRADRPAHTLLAARGDGTPVLAIPLAPAGPPALGARSVVGLYWPFRMVAAAADLDDGEFHAILKSPAARQALGQVWRLGPCYGDDPLAMRLVAAARQAGWSPLRRALGRTFRLDAGDAMAEGRWPPSALLKRLRRYERRLADKGVVRLDRIVGTGWTPAAIDALASIEARSWVGRDTDGSGAKFLRPRHRAVWEGCIADPALRQMLSAVVVRVDDLPVAFSLDLTAGPVQYSIAGSYDSDFARCGAGKFANENSLLWAAERGITCFDWGAGDGGYKSETGFAAGPEILDWLFVRSPVVAAVLRSAWRTPAEPVPETDRLSLGPIEKALIASLTAAGATAAIMLE